MSVDDDPNVARLGTGPITPENMPEALRTMRHFVINEHVAIDHFGKIAEEANKLARKALDRLDDITGVVGNREIDGGGALGRMQDSMGRIETLLRKGLYGFAAATLAFVGDIAAHFLGK